MFWEVLLGSRLGFRWWSPGSLVFYPAVLIGELLGPAPTSPEPPYEKAWTAFNFATLRLPRPTVSVVGLSFLLWGLLGLEVG